MSAGDVAGTLQPNWDERPCWGIELLDHRGIEFVHADRVTVDGGAAVFTNGDVFERVVVTIFGPHHYGCVFVNAGCRHRQEGDDD